MHSIVNGRYFKTIKLYLQTKVYDVEKCAVRVGRCVSPVPNNAAFPAQQQQRRRRLRMKSCSRG